MPANWQLALFGAVPAILAMAYFDRLDAKRPEPRSTLRRVALAGGLSAIPVILIGELLKLVGPDSLASGGASAGYMAALYMSFVIASIPEEAAKLGCLMLFAWRRPEFDERMDGIVYGARAGLGFALVENVAYLLLMPASLSEYVAVFIGRAVLAVPGHATWGGIIGYFAARRRFDGRGPGLLGGYVLAVVLHGVYDAWLFGVPVAIQDGHTWLGLGIAGVPIIAYSLPALIIAGGALTLRELARRAIAADDLAEAKRAAAAGHVPLGHPIPAAHPYPYPADRPWTAPRTGHTVLQPSPPAAPARSGQTLVAPTGPPRSDSDDTP
jgi:RsiW-degrading membrane proteinase PrsW (M82 family)